LTFQSTEFDGQQVIDEKEFLKFYHDLMEREEIYMVCGFLFHQNLETSVVGKLKLLKRLFILKVIEGISIYKFILDVSSSSFSVTEA